MFNLKMRYVFNNCLLILFITVLLFNIRSCYSQTYSISLQSKEKLSLDTWAKYKGKIPELKEFTVCHWNIVSYFSSAIDTLWNHCYTKTKDSPLWCITMDYILLPSHGNRHVLLQAWTDTIVIEKEIIPFPHRKWNHICWSYSSVTRNNILYFNGEEIINLSTSKEEKKEIVEGSDKVYDSALILGQEQDKVGGGYAKNQIFSGEISEFEMWDYVLDHQTITEISNCNKTDIGNVVMWKKELWQVNQGEIIDNLKPDLFCQTKTQHVVFPIRQSQKAARTTCEVHGGRIVTPKSIEENERIKILIEKHPECIDDDKTPQGNWGTLAWLGVKRVDGVWYDILKDGSMSPLGFSLWSMRPLYSKRTNIHCAYMKPDGTWMYIIQNNGTCDYLDVCTVCSIPDTPVFTLKGICHSSAINWNYYIAIDKNKGHISHYDGYKRGEISISDKSWKSLGITHNLTMPKSYKIPYPVGRVAWHIFEPKCGLNSANDHNKYYLTLSICEFPNEFTCDTGQCIDIESRCNGVDDCADESDEKDCSFVEIPPSYKKETPPKKHKESNETLPVITRFRVTNINLIDTTEMIMELTFLIGMKWNDRRLKVTNLPIGIPFLVPSKTTERLWNPLDNILQNNVTIGEVYKSRNQLLRIKSKKAHLPIRIEDPFENKPIDPEKITFTATQRYRIQYICNFELQKFPFDVQGCNFSFRLNNEKNSEISFPNEMHKVIYQGPKTVHQFEFENLSGKIEEFKGAVVFKYNIKITRNYMNQIINTIFPTWLLFLLAYSTVFINLDNFNNRFMGSVTSLLVLTSLLGSINSGLPKTSYFKYIDLWFLWHITIIFLIIIHHVMVDNASRSRNLTMVSSMDPSNDKLKPIKKLEKVFLNKIAIWVFPFINLLFNIIYFSHCKDTHLENM